jgi:glucokinase
MAGKGDKVVLGVDIGGSHLTAALVDLESQSIIPNTQVRQSVNTQASPESIIKSWSEGMLEVMKRGRPFSGKIGIAMPGPFDYREGISFLKGQNKFDSLYGKNVKTMLARELNCQETSILFRNDASSFLQGELFGGAGQGFARALGITLGTGLGSAYAQNGIAEDVDLWQMPFKEGIAEDFLSSRWFTQRYKMLVGQEVNGVKELVSLAGKNTAAQEVFLEFGWNLSAFLREISRKFPPEVVILGGNIAQAYSLFAPVLEEMNKQFPIRLSRLGEEAAIIGVASCWAGDAALTAVKRKLKRP